MDTTQKNELKAIIEKSIQQIIKDINDLQVQCQPLELDCCLDTLAQVEAMQDQSVSQELLRQFEIRLNELKATLQRIDTKGFGLCAVCDEAINFERLKLVPQSTICIDCANEKQ